MKTFLFISSFISILAMNSYSAPMEMAITVDDLPAHGKLPPNMSRVDIASKMLATLKKYQIPEVYGFINAGKIEFVKEDLSVLKLWRAAEYPLGNHAYSHLDLRKVSAQEFIEDIQRNEKTLKEFNGSLDWKYFRYPFLREGETMEKRNAVRKFLFEQNYQIAQVTVDFEEWAWNEPYARCLEKKDQKAIVWLKEKFMENARLKLDQAEKISTYLFKRPVKHILLIHVGAFTAEMMEQLIQAYQAKGVKFISLSAAVKDPIYQEDPKVAMAAGAELTWQMMKARGIQLSETGAAQVPYPGKELEAICQ